MPKSFQSVEIRIRILKSLVFYGGRKVVAFPNFRHSFLEYLFFRKFFALLPKSHQLYCFFDKF